MIKTLFILSASVALATASAAPTRRAPVTMRSAGGTACLGPDDYTDALKESILIVSRSNQPWADTLRAHSHVPVVSDTAIAVVSDSTTCSVALTVYNAHARTTAPIASNIYLLRVGPVFVASNPDDGTDRDITDQIVLDSTLTYIGVFLR